MIRINKDTYKKWLLPFLYSLLYFPRTYFKIFQNIFFLREKESDLITAMSHDGRGLTLPWYMKTSMMYKKYGKHGYYFEEALGMPFSGRFWFDFIPTEAFNKFKYRKIILFSLICILLQFLLMSYYSENIFLCLIFLFFIIPSPLFTRSLLIYGKPEIIAWVLFPSLIWFLFGNPNLVFGVVAIVISFLNFTVFLFAISFVFIAMISKSIPLLWGLWLAPLFYLLLYKIIPFNRHFGTNWLFENIQGTGKKTKTHQNGEKKYGVYNYFFSLLLLLSFSIHAVVQKELVIIFIGFLSVISHFVNNKIVRFSDSETFYRLYIINMISMLLIFPNIYGFFGYLFVGYYFLSYCLIIEKEWGILNPMEYPNIIPVNLKNLKKYTLDVFSFTCRGDRIALEVKGLDKFFGGFRLIFCLWEYCLNPKGVEFIPSEWMRSTCTDYMISDYQNFNAASSKDQVFKVCRDLGLTYVMAYSKAFCENLENWGFISVGIYKSDRWEKYSIRKALRAGHDLKIYKVQQNDNSLIYPITNIKRKGNLYTINFSKEVNYLLKYNYYYGWKSLSENVKIYPVNNNGLNFIGLTSRVDGEATIYYKY